MPDPIPEIEFTTTETGLPKLTCLGCFRAIEREALESNEEWMWRMIEFRSYHESGHDSKEGRKP